MRVKRTDFHLPAAEQLSQPHIARTHTKSSFARNGLLKPLSTVKHRLSTIAHKATATRRRRVASGALSMVIVAGIILQALPAGAAPATVRQEINIINKTYTATNATLTSDEIVQLDTTAYSGTVTYYFEVVANTTASSTGNIALRRSGTSTNDATIALSTVGTSYTRYRTSAFTAPAGQTQYVLYADAAGAAKTLNIKAARIIISQTSDPITATETQIEIGNHETGKNNTTAAPLNNPKYWKYTAANWNPAPTFYAEVTYKATIGTTPVSNTYTASQQVTIPAGVSQVTVEAWGGGGGGGSQGSTSGASNGGGGGAYAKGTVNVTPGTYEVLVGSGGVGNTVGVAGGRSAFGPDTVIQNDLVRAVGGQGGGNSANSGLIGTGGLASSSLGNIVTRNGGNGATGQGTAGGGGGGGAGTNNPGTNATTSAGATGGTVDGGNGGAGGANANGVTGSNFGGGGGGSHRTNGNRTGGTGGNGKVVISYDEPATGSIAVTLQEDDGSFGNWANVTNGTLVTGGTAASSTRVRTGVGFTLIDGRHYRIVTNITNSGSTYDVYSAKIVSKNGWSEIQPAGNTNQNWKTFAMSGDGALVIAGVNNGRLYRSLDAGANWSEVQPAGNVNQAWYSSAISSNGSIMLAGVNNGRLYRSLDAGANWSEVQPAGNTTQEWQSISTSSDGGVIIAGTENNRLYRSIDGGDNWNEVQPVGNVDKGWSVTAINGSGQIMFAGGYIPLGGGDNRLHRSTDGGNNWSEVQPNGNTDLFAHSASVSTDGFTVLVGTFQRLFRSVDGGDNWNEVQPAGNVNVNWLNTAISGDGSIMWASGGSTRLYRSVDGGDNWNEVQPAGNLNQQWRGIASSISGSLAITGVSNGRSYRISYQSLKFESQYLLANTSSGNPTGLKDYDTRWNPGEWSNVNNTYYHESQGADDSNAWSETQPAGNVNQNWYTLSASNDGMIILAGSSQRLYRSTDGGITWGEVQPAGNVTQQWATSVMSNNGQILVAGAYGGRLYRSLDGGNNWSEVQPAGNTNQSWYTSAMSSDGQIILVGGNSGARLYRSIDGGTNWAEVQPIDNNNQPWTTTSMSDDGQTMLAATNTGVTRRLYRSLDGGTNWSEVQPAGNTNQQWQTSAISSDGQTMFAGAVFGRLYRSTNGGTNWSEVQPAGNVTLDWYISAMSNNGQTMLSGARSGRLYRSTNGGTNWSEVQPAGNTNQQWRTSAMSGDGQINFASVDGGRLYSFAPTIAVKLQSSPSSSPTDITSSALSAVGTIKRSTALTMPGSATDIDVNVTATGTLNASRIIVVVDTNTNTAPTTPTLSAPANSATGVSTTPTFQLSSTDTESDYLRYRIEVCTTSNCGVVLRTIDQTSSQTGWSGQNTQTSTAYTSGTTASHTYQAPALTNNTQYWWRASARDPGGSNTWSTVSSINSFTTVAANSAPAAPTITAPADFASNVSISPMFQVTSTDANGDYLRYRIEICDDSECNTVLRTIDQTSSQTGWSGQNTQTSTAYTSGTTASHALQTPALSYAAPYSWRAYAIDPAGSNTWSTASAIYNFSTEFDGGDPPPESSDTYIRGGVRIRGGTKL